MGLTSNFATSSMCAMRVLIGNLCRDIGSPLSRNQGYFSQVCALVLFLSGCQSASVAARPEIQKTSGTVATKSTRDLTDREKSAANLDKATRIKLWNRWAEQNLASGDIIFVRGAFPVMLGLIDFSELTAQLERGEYAHVGMVVIEEDGPRVYDITSKKGVRRREFGKLMTGRFTRSLAIKRPTGVTAEAIPAAVEFIQEQYRVKPKFDKKFDLDNDRFYCCELVVRAYQAGGVQLAEAVPLQDLPGYPEVWNRPAVQLIRFWRSIDPELAVYCPGSDEVGLWANPALKTVLELRYPARTIPEMLAADSSAQEAVPMTANTDAEIDLADDPEEMPD